MVCNTDKQALFGIVQGGMYKDLREESAKEFIKDYASQYYFIDFDYEDLRKNYYFNETCQETAIAIGTRMYAKTYDTQRVPHNKSCSKNTCT